MASFQPFEAATYIPKPFLARIRRHCLDFASPPLDVLPRFGSGQKALLGERPRLADPPTLIGSRPLFGLDAVAMRQCCQAASGPSCPGHARR